MFKHLVLLGEKSTSRSEPENQPKTGWVVALLCLTPDQNHVQQCLNSKRRMKAPHWLQTPGRICVNRPTAPWESSRKSRGELKGASVSKLIWENSLYHIYLTGVTYICSQTLRKKLYRKNMSDKMICSWKQWKIKWKNTRNILNVTLLLLVCILLFCKVCETKCIMQWCFKR